MSSFCRRQNLQALKSWALSACAPLLLPGQDCLLCCGHSGDALVCGACQAALPRLGSACERCAIPLPHAGICGRCQRRAAAFDDAIAVFEYRFPLDRLVQRFKYAGDLAVGRWLAQRLAERAALEPRPDLIVAPPLSAAKLRERGFNQGLVLARHAGQRLGIAHSIGAFIKQRDTPPQPQLGRRQRLANLRHAFRCELPLSGEHVAIVDDVMTTGATAHMLARLLKGRGAGRVSVWAVARTPEPSRKP
jgi:ComF family protein